MEKRRFTTSITLIKKVLVYGGTGTQPFFSDIVIKDKKISKIQKKDIHLNCCEIIDGEGMALASGFINVHSHSDLEELNVQLYNYKNY